MRARPHASRVRATLNPPPTAHKTAQPAGQAQRSARSPLRARPPSQPGTRNAQPAPHCAQDRTARRAGATLSPFTTARKTTQPAGYAQCSTRLPLRKTAQPSGSRHAQPARHCAQNPTARWAGATLSPPPLRARPHASRAGTTLSPHHCAQNPTASQVRATLNPPQAMLKPRKAD